MFQYGSMDGRRIRKERGKIMKPKLSHICRLLHSFPPLKYPPCLIATCDEKGAGKKPKTDVTQNSNRHSFFTLSLFFTSEIREYLRNGTFFSPWKVLTNSGDKAVQNDDDDDGDSVDWDGDASSIYQEAESMKRNTRL